jgi:threonylcarbamoyladenosine tRNA methylthiotransferase MtaB
VKTEGIERIRLSSIEPNLLDDKLIEFVAGNDKVLSHFHIPLQSGSNKVLGLMRRRYRKETFTGRVTKIKELMPLAGIGADVIVGFPGETDADFEDTFNFIEDTPLSYLHVFSYSERTGTAAESLPLKVSYDTKELRSKRLIQLSSDKNLDFKKININQKASVLFENAKHLNMVTGFTDNYLRVEHPLNEDLTGRIRRVIITGIADSGNMIVKLIQDHIR